MPSRRSLLRRSGLALTAGVGLAGCLGDDGGPTSPSAPTPDTTPEPSPTGTDPATGTSEPGRMGDERTVAGVPVVVSNPTAQTSVIHLTTPDSMGVTRAPDGRLVLVDVRVGNDDPATPPPGAPAPDEFVLRTGDRSFRGTVSLDGVGSSLRDRWSKYDPGYGTARGWVAFSVPAPLEADTARVGVDDSVWRLPGRVVDALARPLPTWELVSASLPGSLVAGEPFEVGVEVRNTGEVAGRFRGVLNTAGIGAAYAPHPFVLEVAPGESATWSYRDRAPETGRNVGFYLRTPVGDREASPEVTTNTSTPSATGGDTPNPE